MSTARPRIALVAVTAVLALPAAPAAAAAPSVSTAPAKDVTATSATLHGSLNPNNEPTTFRFEYGTTTAYGSATPDQGPTAAVKMTIDASAPVTGLAPGTTYHFRLVATNASGTRFGGDRKFTTPATLSLSARPRAAVFGMPLVLSGVLGGPSVAGVTVKLEHNPYPFAGFKKIAETKTDAGGRYAFNHTPLVNTGYRTVASTRPQTTSATASVPVRPRISLRARRRGGTVRFAGTVAPAHTGATVRIQRRVRRGWRTVRRVVLRATRDPGRSSYATRLRRPRPGIYRAYLGADADHAAGASSRRRIG